MSDVRIERLTPERIDEVEPLWLSMLAHHDSVMPRMRVLEPDISWTRRRAEYEHHLAEPDAFCLVARLPAGPDPAGYAVATVDGPDETWDMGDRVAELHSLSVAPEVRGCGIGTALLDAVDAELERLNVRDVRVGVVAGNRGALRFYERRGLTPRNISLSRNAS